MKERGCQDVNCCLLYFSGETVQGYDFLVNAVWPEIVCNIEARTPSIFAPGNPKTFHQVSVDPDVIDLLYFIWLFMVCLS